VAWVLRFFPTFCLGNGLYNVLVIDAWEYWEATPLTVWSTPILQIEVIYLALESVVYLVFAIFLDRWSANPRMVSIGLSIKRVLTCGCYGRRNRSGQGEVVLPDDEDVLKEQHRVLEGGANNDLIVLSELGKVYDNGKRAVDSFSLGIPRGECFGLLGVNGTCSASSMG